SPHRRCGTDGRPGGALHSIARGRSQAVSPRAGGACKCPGPRRHILPRSKGHRIRNETLANLYEMTATELGRVLAGKKASSVEITDAFLKRIEAMEEK